MASRLRWSKSVDSKGGGPLEKNSFFVLEALDLPKSYVVAAIELSGFVW